MRVRHGLPHIPPPFNWNLPAPPSAFIEDSAYSLSLPSITPPVSQIEEANKAIVEIEGELEKCAQEVSEYDKSIRELRRQIKEAEDRIRLHKRKTTDLQTILLECQSSRAPTVGSRIPAEVLGEIFQYHVTDPACSPWTLTQICRIWRQVAFRTPRLWGGISIKPNAYHGGARYHNGMESCITVEHLYRALQRAKKAPLDIAISGGLYARPTMEDFTKDRGSTTLDLSERFWLMLEMVGGERMEQWRSLDLQLNPTMQWQDFWSGGVSLRNLETLSATCVHVPMMELLDRTSRKLRTLYFPGEQADQWKAFRSLQKVEDLKLAKDFHSRYSRPSVTLHAISPVLESIPQIKKLAISLAQSSPELQSTTTFPTFLTELRVRSGLNDWNQIIAPSSLSLVYLEIVQTSKDLVELDNPIHLPSLRHLRSVGILALKGLSMLSCPQLDTLEIFFCEEKVATDKGLKMLERYITRSIVHNEPHPFPARRFALCEAKHSYGNLRLLIAQIPTIEELVLKCEAYPKTFFTSLSATRRIKGVATIVTCPNLRKAKFDMLVSMDGSGNTGVKWPEVFPVLKEIVRVRERVGSPLEILDFPKCNGESPIAAVTAEKNVVEDTMEV